MPNFLLNRGYNLVGKGHNIRFEKGVPSYVPPELAREAIAIGAECTDEKIDVLGPEDAPPATLTADDREALFFTAFDLLFEENDATKFGADGRPSVAVLKTMLKFEFSAKDRDAALEAYRASKAE